MQFSGQKIQREVCSHCGRIIELKRPFFLSYLEAADWCNYVQCKECRACTVIGLGTEPTKHAKDMTYRGLR